MESHTQDIVSPEVSQAPEIAPSAAPVNERTFKQQDVDRIVGNAKRDAVETYRRLQTEQPEYWAKKYGETPPQAQNQPSYQAQQSGNVSHDDIRRLAAEEAQRLMESTRAEAHKMAQKEQNDKVVGEFFSKLNSGKEKYQDFDSKLSKMELGKMPNTVYLSRTMDNVTDVFMHLADNPMKALQIEQLTHFNPTQAHEELAKLSQSLKDNEAAASVKTANAPLSQLKPSNIGTDGGGVLSVSDFRRKYKG